MSSNLVRTCAISLVCAVISAFAATPGSWDRFKLTIGNFDYEGEVEAIRDTLKLFSSTLAGFYVSGGNPAGLNRFPAEMPVKQRIFVDLDALQRTGKVLAIDRDRSNVREITLVGPEHAVALVDENWFMQLQEAATRSPASDKKANIITVRYFLKKQWSKWLVVEYEVYGRRDPVLPVAPQWVLTW